MDKAADASQKISSGKGGGLVSGAELPMGGDIIPLSSGEIVVKGSTEHRP